MRDAGFGKVPEVQVRQLSGLHAGPCVCRHAVDVRSGAEDEFDLRLISRRQPSTCIV